MVKLIGMPTLPSDLKKLYHMVARVDLLGRSLAGSVSRIVLVGKKLTPVCLEAWTSSL
jgi:hypothetical protein